MKALTKLVALVKSVSPRTRTLVVHDAGVFAAALLATGVLSSDHLTRDLVISALVTAFKVTLRQLLPVPAKGATT